MGRRCAFVRRPLGLPPAFPRPPLRSNKQKVGQLEIGDSDSDKSRKSPVGQITIGDPGSNLHRC